MTVINNIEIDDIKYCENEIKAAICNNEPIEEKLNVIIVVSNPCQYGTRYLLAREFVRRMELEETNVELYIVELAYNNQQFYVTEKGKQKNVLHHIIYTKQKKSLIFFFNVLYKMKN